MAGILSDENVIKLNNNRIVAGDYFVFSRGIVNITWVTQELNNVNIYLEKTQNGNVSEKLIFRNMVCIPGTERTYQWICTEQVDKNYEYPLYRIKIVSATSNNVVSYSNQFKISVPEQS